MKKFAIVTEGGGMRCAYSAGILYTFLTKYFEFEPSILVGSSGSAGSLTYYVAKQPEEIKRIWTQRVVSRNFLNIIKLNRIMSIDYLIDVVFKIQEPLHTKIIKESKQKLFISATNYKTAKANYFSNNEDIYESLRATKAIPVIYGKKVEIHHKQYIDGNFSSPLSKNIQKAINEGASDIVVIKEEALENKSKLIDGCLKLWGFFQKKNIKKMMDNYLLESNHLERIFEQYKDSINFFVFCPSKEHISALDNTSKNLKKTFNQGCSDCENNKEFEKFIR